MLSAARLLRALHRRGAGAECVQLALRAAAPASRRGVQGRAYAAFDSSAARDAAPQAFRTRWREAWERRTHGVRLTAQERELHELQVALALEGEGDDAFGDLMGARTRISAFVAARLRALGEAEAAAAFERYDALSRAERAAAVDAADVLLQRRLLQLGFLNAHQRAARAAAAAETPPLAGLLTEPGWLVALGGHLRTDSFLQLEAFVHEEWRSGAAVYPPAGCIFEAFNACPLASARVVIVGQDPYHGANQACGLAFSVDDGVPVPSSLRNIQRELRDDLGIQAPVSGSLRAWAASGVLLLNTVLTVRAGEANSHAGRGWEQLTDAAISFLAHDRAGLVFLLWGRHAGAKAALVPPGRGHVVLTAAHPSGLSAHRGFFGSRPFSQANAALRAAGAAPVDWRL